MISLGESRPGTIIRQSVSCSSCRNLIPSLPRAKRIKIN
uniref:Bm13186 n=1 Tax=Brugia malayi TaxID=6279 RepID=A0A1I9G567_BRUMA|nr:Bm13186 [Brugia malayi]